MTENKKGVSVQTPTPGNGRVGQPITPDYNISANNPEAARQAFEDYLSVLPVELQEVYRRFDLSKLTEYLGQDRSNPKLERLLPELRTIGAAELLIKEFPPVPWIVPDYLPPGLTILSGRPKVGKSWLAMQMALSVSTEGKMFDKDIHHGHVLYLALEDSERRLSDRMKKQGWPAGHGKVDFMLYEAFHEQIGSLNSGGGKRLLKYIEANEYRLVIVDTFSRSIKGDQLDSSIMTESVGPLQQQALKMDIGLLFIDHMRKNTRADMDPISDVFGSVAKAGILDTTWALYKEQGKRGAKLAITGRDVDEYILKLIFDLQGFYWRCEGNAYEIELTERRKEILDVLGDIGPAKLKEISEAIGRDPSNTLKRLNDLCNSGLVKRDKNLVYSLAA